MEDSTCAKADASKPVCDVGGGNVCVGMYIFSYVTKRINIAVKVWEHKCIVLRVEGFVLSLSIPSQRNFEQDSKLRYNPYEACLE